MDSDLNPEGRVGDAASFRRMKFFHGKRDSFFSKDFNIVIAGLILFFLIAAALVFSFSFLFFNEQELKAGVVIESYSFDETAEIAYVVLVSEGADLTDFDYLRLVFVKDDGEKYVYRFSPDVSGRRSRYEVSASSIGLENFYNISDVTVIVSVGKFNENATKEIKSDDLVVLSDSKNVSSGGGIGGSSGGGGSSPEPKVEPVVELLVADRNNDFDLRDNVLVLYNKNVPDSFDIATYYAEKRGIDSSRLCGVWMPSGSITEAKYMLGARKTIIEDCLCGLVDVKDCSASKIDEIAKVSPILYLAIMKGIPARMTGTGWEICAMGSEGDGDEPSMDYYLAFSLYRDENIFEKYSGGCGLASDYFLGGINDIIDEQPSSSIMSYVRALNLSKDKMVAHGRIEAIDKNRTFELIDRTLEAEAEGVSGNFIYGRYGMSFSDVNSEFFSKLTSTDCLDYLKETYPDNEWKSENCPVGVNYYGRIPGESGTVGEKGGNIQRVVDAGIYIGNAHNDAQSGNIKNGHSAFDGFSNMLNWRKGGEDCITLCRNFGTEELKAQCRENSGDYFKEINTDCVGVALGFLGWQFRSWPVQYYGFWPYGWSHLSGGNGKYEKTAPVVMEGDAYRDADFTDDKFIRIGDSGMGNDSVCKLIDGSEEECNEIVSINLRQSINVNPRISGENDLNLKFRYRSSLDDNGRVGVRLYVYFDDISVKTTPWQYIDFEKSDEKWREASLDFLISEEGEEIRQILLDVSSSIASAPRGWIDLDAFKLVEVLSGRELSNHDISTFNLSNEWVAPGDYASNVIDRLGGIAWWGSSSHFATGGYAYNKPQKNIGAFYSGRSLGESIAYNSKKGMSAIVYGDPIYRPLGVKMYINDGIENVNCEDSGSCGYVFTKNSMDDSKLSVNAFNGHGNMDGTFWNLSVCYAADIDLCDEKDWQLAIEGIGAVYQREVYEDLSDFISEDDMSSDVDFILRLNVLNNESGVELFNYGFFHYRADSDNDDLPDVWEMRYFLDLIESSRGDFDNDGFWNIEEFWWKTNPNMVEEYPSCYLERHCPEDKSACVDNFCKECNEHSYCSENVEGKPLCNHLNDCAECDIYVDDLVLNDCASNFPDRPHCSGYRCRECIADEHCEGKANPYCLDYKCEGECLVDAECSDAENKFCVNKRCDGECRKDDDCDGDLVCSNNICSDCTEDSDCLTGDYCVFEECVDCISNSDCSENFNCRYDNVCHESVCFSDFDCEDFDDCSVDSCVGGFCQFVDIPEDEECYFCADRNRMETSRRVNMSGGVDLIHDGIIDQNDIDYINEKYDEYEFSVLCNESNFFCDYADVDRSEGVVFEYWNMTGIDHEDYNFVIASYLDSCRLEPHCDADVSCGGDLPFCNIESRFCVECNENVDCGVGGFCFEGECADCSIDSDCGDDYCVGGECRECAGDADCGEGEYCWFNNSCELLSCVDDIDCEDFDDCSVDECVGGVCEFTSFLEGEECYYCADLNYCADVGARRLCRGKDFNRDGKGNIYDSSFAYSFIGDYCNYSNMFCSYTDYQNKGHMNFGSISYEWETNLECIVEPVENNLLVVGKVVAEGDGFFFRLIDWFRNLFR